MTIEPMKAGVRSDLGWFKDRHLRAGYLISLPIFLVPAIAAFILVRNPLKFIPLLIIATLLSTFVWFAWAAHSRAKSGD